MKTTMAQKTATAAALLGVTLLGAALSPQAVQAQGRVFRGAGGYQRVPIAPGSGGYAGTAPLRGSLTWSGDVDDTVTVEIHGQDVHTHVLHGKDVTHANMDFAGRLPDRPMHVDLRDWNGRGEVRVMQQPSEDNDFTAVVRIHDPQRGRSHYSFTLAWRPIPLPGEGRDEGF